MHNFVRPTFVHVCYFNQITLKGATTQQISMFIRNRKTHGLTSYVGSQIRHHKAWTYWDFSAVTFTILSVKSYQYVHTASSDPVIHFTCLKQKGMVNTLTPTMLLTTFIISPIFEAVILAALETPCCGVWEFHNKYASAERWLTFSSNK